MELREKIKELHRRLNVAVHSGYIEQASFNVGMQLLHSMIIGKGCNFVFTWTELTRAPIMQAGKMVADIAPATHFEFYGALQQLERHLGLVTHVSREEMARHMEDSRKEGVYHNFTGMPGVDSYVIMPDTLVFCIYEDWVGNDLDESVAEYVGQFEHTAALPRWVNVGAL